MEVPSGPLASEKSAQVARGDPARVIHVPEEGRNSKRLGAIRGNKRQLEVISEHPMEGRNSKQLGAKRSHQRRTPE
jgi:hypothetical protein